jgi:ABC-type multidrug transport system fused ATPase/permease subunit
VLPHVRALMTVLTSSTKRRLAGAVAASLALALCEIVALLSVVPLMQLLAGQGANSSPVLGFLADLLGTSNTSHLALVTALMMLVAFMVKGIASICCRWWVLGFVYNEEAILSEELLRYYVRAPYSLHLQRNSAELLRTMIESVSAVFLYGVVGLVTVLSELTYLSLILVTLVVLLPIPAFGFLLYFGIAGLAFLTLLNRRSNGYGRSLSDGSLAIYRTATQILGGVKELQVRHNSDHFLSEFAHARSEFGWARRRSAFVSELPKYFLEIIFMTGFALLAVVLFARSASGEALPLLAFVVATGFRILPSVARLLGGYNGLRIGFPALSLVLDDVRLARRSPASAQNSAGRLPLTRELSCERLSFRYPGTERKVLEDINLRIPAGSTVALVGSSGAGKSTLADILMGLHQPTAGRIDVDDVDIRTDIIAWQRSIGMVPQDVYILDATLRANVAFGDAPNAVNERRLLAALTRAQLDDLIRDLPNGVDTIVGERGGRLSGGQRQRIGIARALYLEPSLLVMDEATSALDSETERRITDTIESLHGQMTVIVIAHRLSTVRKCDMLLHLEQGRIAAAGTFESVTAESPAFARLVKLGSLDVEALG